MTITANVRTDRTRQGMAFTTLTRMYQNLCEANGVPDADRKQAVGYNPRSASPREWDVEDHSSDYDSNRSSRPRLP